MTARTEAGFTLLEMLVALAVLSLGALALLNLAGENTRQAGAMEARLFASIVAENIAVEAMTSATPPQPGRAGGQAEAGLQRWAWTRTVAPVAEGALLGIEVRVRPDPGLRTAGEVTVFRSAR